MGLQSCSDKKKEQQRIETSSSEMQTSAENVATLELETKAKLGEGSIWNYKSGELYWVDIESKKVNFYNPKTKTNRTISLPSMVGTVVPKSDSLCVVALEDGIYELNMFTSELNQISDVEKDITTNRFNDGKCDPAGRLWVGSMAFKQTKNDANLYMILPNGETVKKLDSVTISNGIVWTKDKKTMYYIDTPTSAIKAFDFDLTTGNISNERIAVEIPETLGYPDGMTIDNEDKLWVGMWNGTGVLRFDPLTGSVLSKIEVPAQNITSCAFGGDDLETLYITTASIGMTKEQEAKYPLAGSVFKAHPGVKGVPCYFFGDD